MSATCSNRRHWGGGTPTLLNAAMIAALSEAIFEVVPLATGAEFSVEIDPNEVDRLEALVAAAQFPGMAEVLPSGFTLLPAARPLTRIIAQAFDAMTAA